MLFNTILTGQIFSHPPFTSLEGLLPEYGYNPKMNNTLLSNRVMDSCF